jgi:hypothetical protein
MATASKRWSWIAVLALAVVALAACFPRVPQPTEDPQASSTPVPGEGPASISGQVWDDICVVVGGSPGAGCVLAPDGLYRANALRDLGEPGFDGLLVTLSLGQCPAAAWALTTLTDSNGAYSFIGLPQADYCITVDPGAVQNAELGGGSWTVPEGGTGLTPAGRSVALAAGEHKAGINFARDRQYVPAPPTATLQPQATDAPTSTRTPTATGATPTPSVTPSCSNLGELVADVTIPDNTLLTAGQTFVKTWRLRNTGTCTWYSEYSLVFFTGQQMQGPNAVPLPGPVAPGTTVDLSVTLVAPATNGTFKGEWRLRSDAGVTFGLGPQADKSFWVQIRVGTPGATATRTRTSVPGGGARTNTPTLVRTNTPTPTRTPTGPTPTPTVVNGWVATYFNNKTLSGSAVLSRVDTNLDFNWGSGSPGTGVPADNFSARWTRTLAFGQGTYRFRVLADDGVRVWVDDRLIIDDWVDGGAVEKSAELGLANANDHTIKVEFYEGGGDASIKLWWDSVTTPSYPDWKAEFWSNVDLTGSPVLVRNDVNVDFNWALGQPGPGVPSDNFSARWTRTQSFEAAAYRFSALADDGIRVYVDGVLQIDQWHTSDGSQTYTKDLLMTAGNHTLEVRYYEGQYGAKVKLTWAKLGTPTATSTATFTRTATPTSTASPTASTTATSTATGTATATASATATATETPTPTATATDTETPTATATATETETPTATPTPTDTPIGGLASHLEARRVDAAREAP